MQRKKREALEAAGFRVGNAEDFLELSDGESKVVELRIRLAEGVRRLREAGGLSQQEVATKLSTTQPRIARIESAAKGISLDQMFRALFSVGGSIDDVTGKSRPENPVKARKARRQPAKA